jgi:hypothetical protein
LPEIQTYALNPNQNKTRKISNTYCKGWVVYNDEKCFKLFDKSKLLTFEDAKQYCLSRGSTMLTIHSTEEREFIAKNFYESSDLVNEVWLGLRRKGDQFKWIDNSSLDFTSWAIDSPRDRKNYDCVQISSEIYRVGDWIEKPCNRKNLVICQKTPVITLSSLQISLLKTERDLSETKEILTQTRKELHETREFLRNTSTRFDENNSKIYEKQSISNEITLKLEEINEKLNENILKSNETNSRFNRYLSNLLSNKWINYKLFTDTDGKQKAFLIPLNENKEGKTLEEAMKICEDYNSTLVEINCWQKHLIFESFLGQLGTLGYNLRTFWIDGQKGSSGEWKWMSSGKVITYFNWFPGYPENENEHDGLVVKLEADENFCKFQNQPKTANFHIVCEIVFNF